MRRNNRFRKFIVLAVGLAFLNTGCATVGPNYEKPRAELPAKWHTEVREGLNSEALDPVRLASWWTTLNDPILSGLIERATAKNLDLKKARARIREARARRGVARADLFPQIDASASYTRSRTGVEGATEEADLYSAGFDSTWELDLFGGTRRSIEAAEGDLQATEENLRDVLVSLAAELGVNYIEMRTLQFRIAVAEKNLESQKETYLLTQSRARAGLGTELAVQQARYNMESTGSEIPALRKALEESMNRIAILLGSPPGTLHEELRTPGRIPAPPHETAVGVPADILRQRPDVRKAERELAAQTARVGVAVAELYPKLTISGSINLNASTPGSFFGAGNTTSYTFGPNLSIPIFRGGSIRSTIEVQSALQEQALIAYESSILSALEDVENAIAAFSEERKRCSSLVEAVDAARQAVIFAEDQYRAGRTDFSNVLDAQRSLLAFEEKQAQSVGNVTSDLIRLYKALGGGWTPGSANAADK